MVINDNAFLLLMTSPEPHQAEVSLCRFCKHRCAHSQSMLSHCKITSPDEEHPRCLLKWTKWTPKELIQQRGFAVHMLRDHFNTRDSSVLAVWNLKCCNTAKLMGTKGIWEMIAMYKSLASKAPYSRWLWTVDQVQLWTLSKRDIFWTISRWDTLTLSNKLERHSNSERSAWDTLTMNIQPDRHTNSEHLATRDTLSLNVQPETHKLWTLSQRDTQTLNTQPQRHTNLLKETH